MKDVNCIIVNNIIHDFKRIRISVESDNKKLIVRFIGINTGIVFCGINRKTDVLFRNIMDKSRLIKLYNKIRHS